MKLRPADNKLEGAFLFLNGKTKIYLPRTEKEKHMLYNLGRYIKDQRIKKGLHRQELATMLGYKNTNKAARRIEKAELHGKIKYGLLDKLAIALDLDQTEINAAIKQDKDDFETWLNEPVPREMIIRWMAAVYARYELPEDITTDNEALEHAKTVAQEYKRKVCLRLNRRWTYWIKPDGSGFRKETTFKSPVNQPYMQIKGVN